MISKTFITEKEFDDLNYYDMMYYRWCPECKLFYDKRVLNECDHRYFHDPRD